MLKGGYRWTALLLLALVSLNAIPVQGQGRGRSWGRGALKVEDFGVVPFDGHQQSHLEYAVKYTPSGVREGIDSYLYCRTSALMYPTASWMAEGHTGDAELNYNQVLFDLVEVYRRQMQRQSMLLSKKAEYELLLEMTQNNLDREIAALRAATSDGRDSAAVERYRVKNREWLNDNPGDRPEFSLRRYWWGAGVAFGLSIPTGNIARHYSASIGTTGISLAVGLGRHGLYYHTMTGTVQSLDTANGWIPEVDYLNDFNIGYGFTVIDRPSYSITPYVAVGSTEYTWFYSDSYTLGVMGSYHFHHWHRITNGVKHKGKRFTASASANLHATYSRFDDSGDRNGLSFGLQLGFSFITRNERVEW